MTTTISGSALSTGTATLSTPLAVSNGGTGSSTASAAFNALAGAQSGTGYATLGGIIIQWGVSSAVTHNSTLGVTFPIPFPTACVAASGTPTARATNESYGTAMTFTATTLTISHYSSGTNARSYNWIAIGY